MARRKIKKKKTIKQRFYSFLVIRQTLSLWTVILALLVLAVIFIAFVYSSKRLRIDYEQQITSLELQLDSLKSKRGLLEKQLSNINKTEKRLDANTTILKIEVCPLDEDRIQKIADCLKNE